MNKPKTRARLLRDLQDDGIVNSEASLSRNGSATWVNEDLSYTFVVARFGNGSIEWRLAVDDRMLGPGLAKFGGFAVGVHPIHEHHLDWPEMEASIEPLEGEVRPGIEQIKDRDDLCRALMSETDVRGSRTFVWLPKASYPSRLTKALVLARRSTDQELEGAVLKRINALPSSRDNSGKLESGRNIALRYARKYSKELGTDIEIP